jgi:hypothetical protein
MLTIELLRPSRSSRFAGTFPPLNLAELRCSSGSAFLAAKASQRSCEAPADIVIAQIGFTSDIDDILRHPMRYLIYVLWFLPSGPFTHEIKIADRNMTGKFKLGSYPLARYVDHDRLLYV